MEITKGILDEYKDLTTRYVTASQQLRELLPRIADLSKAEKLPEPRELKKLLRDCDRAEEEIEAALIGFRKVRRRLLSLI